MTMNMAIRSDELAIFENNRVALEIADGASGFLDDDHAGGNIPRP